MDETKNYHFFLAIPRSGLSGREHQIIMRVIKNTLGIKPHDLMKNIFVFTVRDTDTQSAREKVLDAMRKAGKEAGVSNFRYIMTQSTCLVNDDIIICDGHQYATEMGFYNNWVWTTLNLKNTAETPLMIWWSITTTISIPETFPNFSMNHRLTITSPT